MFLIDLLKGKGKSGQGGLNNKALKMVPFLIPAIAVVAWAASYQQDCAQISRQKTEIRKNQETIDLSVKPVRAYYQMNSQYAEMSKCLDVITKGLSYRIQTSDLLVELVQTLPEDIFLYEMEMDRAASMERKKKAKTGDIEQRLVVQRNLKLVLCGFDPLQSDKAIREYVDRMKESTLLSEIFAEIKPAGRQQGQVDGRSATYYEIECVLRKQG